MKPRIKEPIHGRCKNAFSGLHKPIIDGLGTRYVCEYCNKTLGSVKDEAKN